MSKASDVFVTGGTGYIGRPLVLELLSRGHADRALVRPGSENRLPAGAVPVAGDALRNETFARSIALAKTFIQLVGVSHPSPAKATEFRSVDLASVRASADAAAQAGVEHFVYLSVAQPAPAIMKAYAAVRAEGEAIVRATGMNATFLRPWYVLGPGHRWPYLLVLALLDLQATPGHARRSPADRSRDAAADGGGARASGRESAGWRPDRGGPGHPGSGLSRPR
jgi:uncharacterized protein YbjT (DUF2867 family)